MASYADIFMGQVFLKSGRASFAQVAACLEETAPGRNLAQVLTTRGFLHAAMQRRLEQVAAHMQFLRGELVYAQILVEHRLVTKANVDRAFQIQKQMGCRQRIGEILVLWQKLTPAQAEAVCDEQLVTLADEMARIEAEGLAGAGYGIAHAQSRAQNPFASAVVQTAEPVRPPAAEPAAPDPVRMLSESSEFDPHELDMNAPAASDSIFDCYSPAATLPVDSGKFAASIESLSGEDFRVPAGLMEGGAGAPAQAVTAERIQRAFESALLMAGMKGVVEHCAPLEGQDEREPVQVIYDASSGVFKAPLSPMIGVDDVFQLGDGNIFKVTGVEIYTMEGLPCYQQVDAFALGRGEGLLKDSWGGR